MTGWDDPRMPTIAGLRRRGVTPEAIRAFAETIGVARSDARIELATFEHAVRDDLNMRVPRVMAVLRPLKLVLDELSRGPGRELDAPLYPHDVPIDGLAPGAVLAGALDRAGRLHGGPAEEVLPAGPGARGPAALRLFGDLHGRREGRGGRGRRAPRHLRSRDARRRRARRPQGAGHHPLGLGRARARLRAAAVRPPVRRAGSRCGAGGAGLRRGAQPGFAGHGRGAPRSSPASAADPPGSRYQFERTGYFVSDPIDSKPGALVFNRTVALRDSWAKVKGK